MTLEEARSPHCLLFEAVLGSQAYGLATPQSDEDLRGIFIPPLDSYLGFERLQQVNNPTSDLVYYEVGRFCELALKNNPGLLELLFAPPDCIRHEHPLMQKLRRPEMFLSKRCFHSFAGYALSQIKRARGLNKKIVNPQPQERKGILDFCHVVAGQGSVPVLKWLREHGLRQEEIGLVAIDHMREIYAMFAGAGEARNFRGIIGPGESTDVHVSSIPRGMQPVGWMSFNKDGFKKHCKDWAEYQEWLKNRNETRYRQTETHGRGYDAKNMMHTFRLLDAAEEIARHGTLTVRVPEARRDFLFSIRTGKFEYDYLLNLADQKMAEIEHLYQSCSLPENPTGDVEEILVSVRREFWGIAGH